MRTFCVLFSVVTILIEWGKKFCVIVLNWNNATDTIQCLESILPAVRKGTASIIVSDNASTDDSVQRIIQWAISNIPGVELPQPPNVEEAAKQWDFMLIRTSSNRGYAGGNNAAIRQALLHNAFPYVFLLNNDTILHPDALDEMSEFTSKHPTFGIIGSTILQNDDRELVQCAGGCTYNPWTTIFRNHHGKLRLHEVSQKSSDSKFDYISGAASVFKSELFGQFGLLDERYFLYYEELDFARRLKGSNYRLGWCKDSLVFHKGGANSTKKVTHSRDEHIQRNYHENLSTLLFTKKYHSNFLVVPAVLRLFGKLFSYTIQGKLYLFPSLFSAYSDFLRAPDGHVSTVAQQSAEIVFMSKAGLS